MTEEPYRWLEAVANRRDYVREQLKDGSPVFAASLDDGILLLGVGSGQSKVFELFDRHAMAGLGHPADIEKIRQAAIDAAHLEAFTRAPEDVSLRRLIGFGLGPQLKTAFEQIFSAPFLIELILAELGDSPEKDLLFRLRFDGTFQSRHGGIFVAASQPGRETEAAAFLHSHINASSQPAEAAARMLETWWCLTHAKPLGAEAPDQAERTAGWKTDLQDRVVEIGWLSRRAAKLARFETLSRESLGL
jgi:proteasome alpha subunit